MMTERAGMGRGEIKKEGIYIYSYNWFALLYGRNQHNMVKQLSSN